MMFQPGTASSLLLCQLSLYVRMQCDPEHTGLNVLAHK